MQAFAGTFEHTLDGKGRVILPARFRDVFGAGVVLAKSPNTSLEVWTTAGFDRRVDQLREWAGTDSRARNFMTVYLSGASTDTPDSQGRLTVPAPLREFAGLDRELAIVGQGPHLEIWDRADWTGRHAAAQDDFLGMELPL